MFDQSGSMPFSAAMSSSAFATCCCPAVEVPSQTAKVVAAAWLADFALTARP